MRPTVFICGLLACGGRSETAPDATTFDSTFDGSSEAGVPLDCRATGVQPGAPWPMTGGNLARTGRSPFKGPRSPSVRWSYAYGQNFGSSPAVAADGTVYVTSMPGYLRALVPDGTEKWNHGEVDAYASPAIGCDGVVYVWGKQATSIEMPDQSVLVAIDPDGKTMWSHTRTTKLSHIDSSPAPAPGGRVIESADALYSFRLDGGLEWSLGIFAAPRPVVRADGTTIGVVGFSDDAGDASARFMAILPDGGTTWEAENRGAYGLLAPDGRYYTGSKALGLTAYGPSGAVEWTLDVPLVSPPALAGDLLYVPTKNGLERVHLSTRTHEIVLPGPFDDLYPAVVVDAEGIVYFTYKETVTALKPDGTTLFTLDLATLGDRVDVTAPALADGVLYVAAYQHLVAIGP